MKKLRAYYTKFYPIVFYIPNRIRNFILKIIFKISKRDSIIRKIKDTNKGKECFIFGNAPSLAKFDFNLIGEIDSFAVNKIYNVFDQTSWRPTYYAVGDWGLVRTDTKNILNVDAKITFIGIENRISNYFKYRKIENVIMYHKKSFNSYNISEDLSKYVSTAHTVLFEVFQIVFFMGYKTIYLGGVDADYSQNTQHFYNEMKKLHVNPNRDKLIKCFIELKKYADLKGIKIYNVNTESKLDVFEFFDLKNQ